MEIAAIYEMPFFDPLCPILDATIEGALGLRTERSHFLQLGYI
jgi:hypothetical protein